MIVVDVRVKGEGDYYQTINSIPTSNNILFYFFSYFYFLLQ